MWYWIIIIDAITLSHWPTEAFRSHFSHHRVSRTFSLCSLHFSSAWPNVVHIIFVFRMRLHSFRWFIWPLNLTRTHRKILLRITQWFVHLILKTLEAEQQMRVCRFVHIKLTTTKSTTNFLHFTVEIRRLQKCMSSDEIKCNDREKKIESKKNTHRENEKKKKNAIIRTTMVFEAKRLREINRRCTTQHFGHYYYVFVPEELCVDFACGSWCAGQWVSGAWYQLAIRINAPRWAVRFHANCVMCKFYLLAAVRSVRSICRFSRNYLFALPSDDIFGDIDVRCCCWPLWHSHYLCRIAATAAARSPSRVRL